MSIEYLTGDIQENVARPKFQSLKRGFAGKCPHCAKGSLFRAYLKPVDECAECGEVYSHQRADDLPAYLVVLIVGHISVGGFMLTEMTTDWPGWLHLAIWVPVTILLSLLLLQPIKGAVIGLQWANQMHGFGGEEDGLDHDHGKPLNSTAN
jgi:uncharacterized protein (DUF983 family)